MDRTDHGPPSPSVGKSPVTEHRDPEWVITSPWFRWYYSIDPLPYPPLGDRGTSRLEGPRDSSPPGTPDPGREGPTGNRTLWNPVGTDKRRCRYRTGCRVLSPDFRPRIGPKKDDSVLRRSVGRGDDPRLRDRILCGH